MQSGHYDPNRAPAGFPPMPSTGVPPMAPQPGAAVQYQAATGNGFPPMPPPPSLGSAHQYPPQPPQQANQQPPPQTQGYPPQPPPQAYQQPPPTQQGYPPQPPQQAYQQPPSQQPCPEGPPGQQGYPPQPSAQAYQQPPPGQQAYQQPPPGQQAYQQPPPGQQAYQQPPPGQQAYQQPPLGQQAYQQGQPQPPQPQPTQRTPTAPGLMSEGVPDNSNEAFNYCRVNISRSADTGKVANNNTIPHYTPQMRQDAMNKRLSWQGMPNYAKGCKMATVRPTHSTIHTTPQTMEQMQVPFGCLVRPLADKEVPLVDFASIGKGVPVVRCRRCKAYINPFATFVDGGKRWVCPLCRIPNDCSPDYYCPLNQQSGVREDVMERSELSNCTVEFVAPTEYMVRPPQRPIFTFLLDVSYSAVSSGMLRAQCEGIRNALEKLRGDDCLYVSIMAFDAVVYLFNLRSTLSTARMIVAADLVYDTTAVNEHSVLDPVELPALPEDLIVPLGESIDLIEGLLEQLPIMFADNKCVDSCFGPALTAAISLMTPVGGKIVASVGSIPTLGEGKLTARYDPSLVGQPKEYTMSVPASDWYKHRSLAASQAQISIDLVVNGDAHVDLATLAPISRYTSGHIYRYTSKTQEGFTKQMERILLRNTAFESVLRIRTSSKLAAPNFFGHCFVRGADLLALPLCDEDTTYAVQLNITEKLTSNVAYVQFALLYTTSTRERRIRVHTFRLGVSNSPAKVMNGLDELAVAGMMTKTCIDMGVNNPIAVAQQKTTDRLSAILKYLKGKVQDRYLNQMLVPESLKHLPQMLAGFYRCAAVRSISSLDTLPDDRVASMSLFMTSPIESLTSMFFNWLYIVYTPKEKQIGSDFHEAPPSLSSLRNDCLFLMETGFVVYAFIGKYVPPQVLEAYGLPLRDPLQSPVEYNVCPFSEDELVTLSTQYRDTVDKFQRIAAPCQVSPLEVSKHGQTSKFLQACLVEDDAKPAVSYLNFLTALYKKAQEK